MLPSLATRTADKVASVFNAVETIINPARLVDLNSDQLSIFQSKLRDGNRSESTIEGYMAHLKAALRWAAEIGLLVTAPKIKRPPRPRAAS